MIVPVLATYVDFPRLQSCLLWSINCEWNNVRNTLVFLARSNLVYWFLLCLSRVLSQVYPPVFDLWVHCCSSQLYYTVYTPVLHQHYANYCNDPDLTPIQSILNGDHNDRFITGNINLYFNKFKLKSIYWQTISYNKICSCPKFSFLSLLIIIKSQLVRQPAASNVNMINAPPFLTLLPSSVSSIVHN